MVPEVGIEPTLPKEPDFESGASANSATQAYSRVSATAFIIVRGFGFATSISALFSDIVNIFSVAEESGLSPGLPTAIFHLVLHVL